MAFGDILEEEGRQVEAQIHESGGEALFVRLDVTSESNWEQALSATVGRFGKLDILVNNAGILPSVDVDEISESEWDRVMAINTKGVFLGTKAAVPEMRKAGGGSIVNISSIAGMVGNSNTQPVYNASKGAVRVFTKSTALKYASDGIRVNSVHPGPIVTAMTEVARTDPEKFEFSINRVPMARYGDAMEVAYGVLFLASDEASFMTGAELVIDGGVTVT